MEFPNLEEFDMVRFLEDHRDSMWVSNDRIYCTISDEVRTLFNFEVRYFDLALNDVPGRFTNNVNLKLSELKVAARELAYLAPYCQKKETEGE